jgi:diguanylate cyclase (GGDEF)-like protein
VLVALLVLDPDHFKRINDSHGHAAGDAALRLLSASLALTQRTSDVVARLGGEEFAVLLPHGVPAAAQAFDHRLRLLLTGRAPPTSALR